MSKPADHFTFTVGKLDAGMAILLGERAHLIEFPSILLPPGATAGSIVNIAVHRNLAEEKRRDAEFWDLQKQIYDTYGVDTPQAPELNLRNVTQTSVTLVWPPLHLATSKLRSLDIYRNGQRLAAIPQPHANTSTKLSGLELDREYSFQLILRTTAGTFPSNVLRVRTHTMAETSGICVCFGNVQDETLLEDAKFALEAMKAKWSEKIQIDTTHFVCTTPAAVGPDGKTKEGQGPGVEYQRALQLSIPVVQPQWILACHAQKRMVPIANFYLGATPNTAPAFQRPQSVSQVNLQKSPTRGTGSMGGASASAGSGSAATSPKRASMPPPRRSSTNDDANTSTFVGQSSPPGSARKSVGQRIEEEQDGTENVEEESDDDDGHRDSTGSNGTSGSARLSAAARRARNGTMDRNFKFPPSGEEQPPPLPPLPPNANPIKHTDDSGTTSVTSSKTPEVPPPDPVEKEKSKGLTRVSLDEDEEVGETEEISLN